MNYKNKDEEGDFRPPYVDPLSGLTATAAPQAAAPTDAAGTGAFEMSYEPSDGNVDDVIHAAMDLLGQADSPAPQGTQDYPGGTEDYAQAYGDASIAQTLDALDLSAGGMASILADLTPDTAQLMLHEADADAHYDYDSLLDSIMTGADFEPGQRGGDDLSATGNLTNILAEVQAWDAAQGNGAEDKSFASAAPDKTQAPAEESIPLPSSAFLKELPSDGTARAQAEAVAAAQEEAVYTPPPSGIQRPDEQPNQMGNWSLQGSRKRDKPKIAAESRKKGLQGSFNLDKTTLNMAMQMKTLTSPSRAVPVFLLALACIAAFSWFGVIKPLEHVNALESTLSAMQAQRDQLTASVENFVEVQKEHQMYGNSWMSEVEQQQVDALEVLTIVERELIASARVKTASLDANLLSVTMSGVTLDATAAIVNRLEKLELVKSVAVYTAVSEEDRENIVSEGGYIPEEIPSTPASGEAMNTTVTMAIMLEKPALVGNPAATPVAPTDGAAAAEEANPA